MSQEFVLHFKFLLKKEGGERIYNRHVAGQQCLKYFLSNPLHETWWPFTQRNKVRITIDFSEIIQAKSLRIIKCQKINKISLST